MCVAHQWPRVRVLELPVIVTAERRAARAPPSTTRGTEDFYGSHVAFERRGVRKLSDARCRMFWCRC